MASQNPGRADSSRSPTPNPPPAATDDWPPIACATIPSHPIPETPGPSTSSAHPARHSKYAPDSGERPWPAGPDSAPKFPANPTPAGSRPQYNPNTPRHPPNPATTRTLRPPDRPPFAPRHTPAKDFHRLPYEWAPPETPPAVSPHPDLAWTP